VLSRPPKFVASDAGSESEIADSQLATSSSNAPQLLSNGAASATQTSAPSSVPSAAAATQTLATASVSPVAVATQPLAVSIPPAALTSAPSSVSATAETLAASSVLPAAVATQTSAASTASPNRPDLAHVFSGNVQGGRGTDKDSRSSAGARSRGGSARGPNGGVLGRVVAAIDDSLTGGGETGGRVRIPDGGGVHGAPGPAAGVGLPSLILFGGIAYLVVRRRRATPVWRP
jgi:hypothetical protein